MPVFLHLLPAFMLFFTCNIVLFSITFYCISPSSKFTCNSAYAPSYSQRISRELSSPRLSPLRLPKMPYGYFACGLTQAVFEPHLFQSFRDLITGKICPVDFLMSGFPRTLHRFMVIFPANRSRYQICGLPGINIWMAAPEAFFHPTLPMHCSTWHLPDNTDSFVHVNF